MPVIHFILVVFLLIPAACNKSDTQNTAAVPANDDKAAPEKASQEPLPTFRILQQPIEATMVETPDEALPIWRKHARWQPALVLLSNDPYLQPVPSAMREEATELLRFGSDRELKTKAAPLSPDPTLLPSMALRAAVEAGFFSQVVWIFPSKQTAESLDLEIFRRQLLEGNVASAEEAQTFTLQGDGFHGKIAGIPFAALHPTAVVPISEPVVLHFDLSYLQPLYNGEIKTPLYPLITRTLAQLKDQQWQVAIVSICQANQPGGLPLATRFIARDLATLLKNPTMLVEDLPLQWARRSQALYLENFMRKEEIRDIYLQMEATDPKDPSVKYALYHTARQFKEPDTALQYLAAAVALDPVYANEYLALADLALEKKGPVKALEMLELARGRLPENPFILMSMAHAALNAKQRDLAAHYLSELQKLSWSDVYYSGVRQEIGEMMELAQQP